VLWPLTTGNKKKFYIYCAVFWHISWFLHKIYAATMERRVERAHIFFITTSGAAGGSCPPATPLAPPMTRSKVARFLWVRQRKKNNFQQYTYSCMSVNYLRVRCCVWILLLSFSWQLCCSFGRAKLNVYVVRILNLPLNKTDINRLLIEKFFFGN